LTVDEVIDMIHEEFKGVKVTNFNSVDDAVKVAASALKYLYDHIEKKDDKI
jgi:hypothetical protein